MHFPLLRLPLFAAALLFVVGNTLIAEAAPGLRLIDVSFDILAAAGSSSWDAGDLVALQAGGHDPRRRGFTLQQGELSLVGAVDPFFRGAAHLVFTEEGVEPEEIYAATTALPYGLELKAGNYFAEFGRINARHPHAWTWMDQPIINSRLFGPDGMRAPGARLAWLLPTPFYSQLTAGAMHGAAETMGSFLGPWHGAGHAHGAEEAAGGNLMLAFEDDMGDPLEVDSGIAEDSLGFNGRPSAPRAGNANPVMGVFRLENGAGRGQTEAVLGLSAAYGENAQGGSSGIYGADLALKWVAAQNTKGYPFATLEAEVMERQAGSPAVAFSGSYTDATGTAQTLDYQIPAELYRDFGASLQLSGGWRPGWKLGLRAEFASGTGDGVHDLQPEADSRWEDSLRQDRYRLSPLLVWQGSEFSRVRLQYNYDFRAVKEGPTTGHTVWVGLEVLYGTHPAHKF